MSEARLFPAPPFDCLLLAAGASTRMGAWKLALPWGASTIVETCLDSALAACRRVIVVTGHHGEELGALLAAREREGRVERVANPRPERGMLSSVQAGIPRVGTPRFYLALADMPGVTPEVYRLLASFPGEAVIPKYRGKKGHPLLLSAAVARRILELGEGDTLREALAAFPTLAVPVDDPGVLQDVDLPEDYRRLRGGTGADG